MRYLIGSADMMPRNLDRRVEVCVQVDDPQARERLAEVLEVNLLDDRLSWSLRPDGRWEQIEPKDPEHPCNAHLFLAERSQKRARRRREEVVEATPLRTHR